MRVEIDTVREADDELAEALAHLLPQLSPHLSPPGHAALAHLVAADGTTVLLARVEQRVVGTLTLLVYALPSGVRARIEDVVVDTSTRGQGVGRALIEAALTRATAAGAGSVELTSNPTRRAAHRLYQSMGFELRDTRVYRRPLQPHDGHTAQPPAPE